jgi:hypothetical protein
MATGFSDRDCERIARTVAAHEHGTQSLEPASPRQFPSQMILRGKPVASIFAGTSGDVAIYDGLTSDTIADSGQVAPSVYNRGGDVAPGDWVSFAKFRGGWEILSGGSVSFKIGKADAAISKGSSGIVSLWDLPSSPWSLCPDGDGTLGGWTTEAGSATNVYKSVHDDPSEPDDTKYAKNTTVSNAMFLKLRDTPANFDVATAVSITIRCKRTGDKSIRGVRIYKADESTPLTADATITDSSSFTNYTVKPNLTGDTDKTSWDGARIKIDTGSGGTTGEIQISAVTVFVSYKKLDATATWTDVVDTCKNMKAYARLGAVKFGKWVYVYRFAQGYEVVNAEC